MPSIWGTAKWRNIITIVRLLLMQLTKSWRFGRCTRTERVVFEQILSNEEIIRLFSVVTASAPKKIKANKTKQ